MTEKEFNEALYKELEYIKKRCYPTDKYSIFEPCFIQSMTWLYGELTSNTCKNCQASKCCEIRDKYESIYGCSESGSFGCNEFVRKEKINDF